MVVEYVEMIIASAISIICFCIMSDIIFDKSNQVNLKNILIMLLYSIILGLIIGTKELKVDGLSKILIFYILMILFNKSKYKQSLSDSVIGTFIVYLVYMIIDTIIQIGVSVICVLLNKNIFSDVIYSYGLTIIMAIITIIITYHLKEKLKKLFNQVRNYSLAFMCILILIFITAAIITFNIPIDKGIFAKELLITDLLLFVFIITAIYIMKEKGKTNKLLNEYKQLAEYAKVNENLLEDYRVSCHENKNHLIIIDNMVSKSNKKVHDYINSISQGYKMNKYYFINELKNIPIVELKGFINFKLMQMLNGKMNLQINVSPEIKNCKLTKLSMKDKEDLYNIVGVLLDNAYDASKESKEKEVIFQMYKENTTIVLLIANTYKGTVEVDKVFEYGYSSKGKNHGTGLYIVERIINKNDRLSKETNIIDNYFVQTIKLK